MFVLQLTSLLRRAGRNLFSVINTPAHPPRSVVMNVARCLHLINEYKFPVFGVLYNNKVTKQFKKIKKREMTFYEYVSKRKQNIKI